MGRKFLRSVILALVATCIVVSIPVSAQKKLLSVTYPPNNYKTKVDKVFFIGAAPPTGALTINGQPIDRNEVGNFAPTLPLREGNNDFSVRYQSEEIKIRVTKDSKSSPVAVIAAGEGEPHAKATKMPVEAPCVTVPTESSVNAGVALTSNNGEPQALYGAGRYLGCAIAKATGTVEQPATRQQSSTVISIKPLVANVASPASAPVLANLEVAEVLANDTISRTGPSSDYDRATPLPRGTKATVVRRQDGDNNGKKITWAQLDYGGWVSSADIKVASGVAPKTVVRSIRNQVRNGNTEVIFPLQVPVPLVMEQSEKTLKLTLYNTTLSSEVVKLSNNPVIDRVDVKSIAPSQVEYIFTYKSRQQWGYKYRYDGNNLVLSLRHPPQISKQSNKPLTGVKILLDPGHGGADSGAVGQNGYTEKEANLFAAKLLANELFAKGATVYLTRETDKAVSLDERRGIVEKLEPTIALSVHYNSLPQGADPAKSKGFSAFWYHSQAQGLANFLHTYVTQFGERPQYGVIWDNLALARPAAAPSVLMELGFMSNPEEFQWISDPQSQQRMAKTLANGITQWFMTVN
jgi:N-acetylmuramoyl-L-alanine amidase